MTLGSPPRRARLGRRQHHHAGAAAGHGRPGRVAVARPRKGRRRPQAAHARQRHEPAPIGVAEPDGERPTPIEPVTGTPTLEAAGAYTPKDGVLQIDISEYAGYGGLIVANGGLEPNPEFVLRQGIRLQGEDLHERERNLVAAQQRPARGHGDDRGCARGARPAVRRRGAAADRLLARRRHGGRRSRHRFGQRARGQDARRLAVQRERVLHPLSRAGSRRAGDACCAISTRSPPPDALGLVFYEDAFVACDAYDTSSRRQQPRLQGLRRLDAAHRRSGRSLERRRQGAGLEPQPARDRRRARREQGLRQGESGDGAGLVHGILEGNRRLRDNQAANIAVVAKAFGWTRSRSARRALARAPVEPAGEPRVLRRHHRLGRLVRRHLPVLGARLRQRDQESRPIRRASSTRATSTRSPRKACSPTRRSRSRRSARRRRPRSKAIRCSARTSASSSSRTPRTSTSRRRRTWSTCDTIKRFLQVSPGSTVLLRGHVDNARVNEFRQQGGEQLVKSMALKAMELSRQRALAVQRSAEGAYPGDRRGTHRSRRPRLGRARRARTAT